MYIEWRRLQKPPDNLPLRQTLPPALYARVEALKNRYDPKDKKLEQMRPMLAARELLTRVFDAAGLALHNEVQQSVLELARASRACGCTRTSSRSRIPSMCSRTSAHTPLDREVACLEAVVTLLETDLGRMQARARAWALGDVDTLRSLPHSEDRSACLTAVSTSERVRSLIARAQADWLISVEDSLGRNRGTLAVQSMDRLLGEHGALAALQVEGLPRRGAVGASARERTPPGERHAGERRGTGQPLRHAAPGTAAERGSATVAPSTAPTANPARCAMTSSVPSPADPVQPSRITPATSGPQRRAQRCGSGSARARNKPTSPRGQQTPRWRRPRTCGPAARAVLPADSRCRRP